MYMYHVLYTHDSQDYEASKYYVQQILQFEPNNRQAKQLQQLIINKQKQGK